MAEVNADKALDIPTPFVDRKTCAQTAISTAEDELR